MPGTFFAESSLNLWPLPSSRSSLASPASLLSSGSCVRRFWARVTTHFAPASTPSIQQDNWNGGVCVTFCCKWSRYVVKTEAVFLRVCFFHFFNNFFYYLCIRFINVWFSGYFHLTYLNLEDKSCTAMLCIHIGALIEVTLRVCSSCSPFFFASLVSDVLSLVAWLALRNGMLQRDSECLVSQVIKNIENLVRNCWGYGNEVLRFSVI